jgi:glycosyltransferase involved in cell wall biosynthesis
MPADDRMSSTISPLRLACYGFVDRSAGSVATANFLMIESMLRRGHTIDFYTFEGFVYPEDLFQYSNFNYHTVPSRDSIREHLPRIAQKVVGKALSDYFYYQQMADIGMLVTEHHAARPFDAMMFLGTTPQCRIADDLPVIAWVQGPPQTEWEAIRSLRSQIIEWCGITLYLKLKAYYAFKQRAARHELTRADRIVCGSEWSRQQIIRFGQKPHHVFRLPYPFDLDLFTQCPPRHERPYRFLWLGRIDPRKRLDLMLDGFAYLLERRSDIHLHIVGRTSYAPGYLQMIDQFNRPSYLTHTDFVPREDVVDLIAGSDVIVQPSMFENFGSSVAEALACGRPVVLGSTNGTGEFTGPATFRFSAYTAAAVGEAMGDALQAIENDAVSLANRARVTAESEYQLAHVVDSFLSIVRNAIDGYDRTSCTAGAQITAC